MPKLFDAETRVRAVSGAAFVAVVMGAISFGLWTNAVLWLLVGGLAIREFCQVETQRTGVSLLLVSLWFLNIAALNSAMPFAGGAYNAMHVFGLVWMIWANDTGAYVVGKPLGRHKLWPRISPGKTWEGFAGGLVAAAFVAGLIFGWSMMWMGAAIGALATAGDLTQSGWKRQLGIKDSGNLIPGHGGILDRFDGFLYAAPAYWLIMRIFVP